jgi:hypothetical protein
MVVSDVWPIEEVDRDEHLYTLIILTLKMEVECTPKRRYQPTSS